MALSTLERPTMRQSPLSLTPLFLAPLFLAALLSAAVAAAPASACRALDRGCKDELIRLIADATAWSEMCVNFAVDPAALAGFRHIHGISVDGHYTKVFGFAHARQHAAASAQNRFYAACDRALALYGPAGGLAPGLVRPLFPGTVSDRKIDLDRW
jgi:hypothetical protein